MKTTLRESIWNIGEQLIDEHKKQTEISDIDYEKTKADVLHRIKANPTVRTHPKRNLKTLLIAATLFVIFVLGATAICASVNFKSVFSNFLTGDLNSAGLYNSENVSVICPDNDLNVNLLGITGDDKKIYVMVEVTKKDGSAFTEEGFDHLYNILNTDDFGCYFECTDKNGISPERCNGKAEYSLSSDRKTIKLCILAMNGDENVNLKDGSMHLFSNRFGAIKVLEKIAKKVDIELSNEMGAQYGWDKEWSEIEDIMEKAEASLDESGITDYVCQSVDGELCLVQHNIVPMSFEMEIELNYETSNIINKTLTPEDAPDFIEETTTEVKLEITPFGLNLYGKCAPSDSEIGCFKLLDYNQKPRIILEDGTTYYLYHYGIDAEGIKDGYYTEEAVYNLSTVTGPAIYHSQVNLIDPQNVKAVIINENIIYSK